MRISDDHVREFRYHCEETLGREVSLDEAREALSRTLYLLERYARWVAREKAKGQTFE